MDVRELRYFVSVVEMGSLSKAAGVLAISQPSLSQRIAGMEFDLGVPLLLRSQTGVRPTDAGTKLYRHARIVLGQMQLLEAEVSDQSDGASGDVAVGLPTSVAAVIAAPLVERMRLEHPGVRLQVFESFSGYLGELIANGRLDMAVLFRKNDTPGLSVRPLFSERLAVFGAIEAGDRDSRECDLESLADVPFVLPGRSNGLRSFIERVFELAEVRLNVIADVDSLSAMLDLARRGTAATINSAAVAKIVHPSILARRVVNPSIERPICICRPTALPQSAAALAAEETIRTLMRENSELWDKVFAARTKST